MPQGDHWEGHLWGPCLVHSMIEEGIPLGSPDSLGIPREVHLAWVRREPHKEGSQAVHMVRGRGKAGLPVAEVPPYSSGQGAPC